jgi:1,4-dihydroxy-6-naphthoate synthase
MSNQQSFELGFSPCPNDTFIMDALVHNRIHSEFEFVPVIHDVDVLNNLARNGELSITKLSFGAYPFVSDKYQILAAGSALGRGCGPLLISKKAIDSKNLSSLTVAIPGKTTTANLLLSILYPEIKQKKVYLFSEIENAVLSGEVDLGLIIHENRFTYQQKGLLKFADLGEKWEVETGLPIPLGCIAVKRTIPEEVKAKISELLAKSVEYAFQNPNESKPYIHKYAQEMDESVQQQHIHLYVNNFSINLGEEGKNAIRELFHKGAELDLLQIPIEPLFID